MQELSMNILDIAENSVKAGASLVGVTLNYADSGMLTLTVSDDGCGMTEETAKRVLSPFYTTRTTRKVGLGLPFLKMAAEMTGGDMEIETAPGKGTVIRARFDTKSIDMMPLGDMGGTMSVLISGNPHMDFCYTLCRDGRSFTLDSREIKQILAGVPVESPGVAVFIREYTEENSAPVLGGLPQ